MNLACKFGKIRFVHVFREQNKVADALAKKALEFDKGIRIFDRMPNWVLPMIMDDRIGAIGIRSSSITDH